MTHDRSRLLYKQLSLLCMPLLPRQSTSTNKSNPGDEPTSNFEYASEGMKTQASHSGVLDNLMSNPGRSWFRESLVVWICTVTASNVKAAWLTQPQQRYKQHSAAKAFNRISNQFLTSCKPRLRTPSGKAQASSARVRAPLGRSKLHRQGSELHREGSELASPAAINSLDLRFHGMLRTHPGRMRSGMTHDTSRLLYKQFVLQRMSLLHQQRRSNNNTHTLDANQRIGF